MDSSIRIVDLKTCSAVLSLKDGEFNVSYSWLSSSFSPDGKSIVCEGFELHERVSIFLIHSSFHPPAIPL
jgi:hypothetical protein